MSLETNIAAVKKHLDKLKWKYFIHGDKGEIFQAYFKSDYEIPVKSSGLEIIMRVNRRSVTLTARSCYTVSSIEEKCLVMEHIVDLHDDDTVSIGRKMAWHKKKKETVEGLTDTPMLDYIDQLINNRLVIFWKENFKLGCCMVMPVVDWTKVGQQLDKKLPLFHRRVLDLREALTKEIWKHKRKECGDDSLTIDMWAEVRDVEQDAGTFMERMRGLISNVLK